MAAETRLTRTNPATRVRVTSGLVLVAIACITIAGQFVVDRALARAEETSTVINVAGRQRMLSQRIGLASLDLVAALEAGDPTTCSIRHEALRAALDLWESSQRALRDHALGSFSAATEADADVLYAHAAEPFDRTVGAARALLAGTEPQRRATFPVTNAHALSRTVVSSANAFLPIMDHIVTVYDDESSAQVAELRRAERVLTATQLIVLMLAAILVFEPTARRLRRQHDEVRRQRDAVDRARDEKDALLRELRALRGALENHAILWVADGAGTIVDVNRGICELSGYSRDELLGDASLILNSGARAPSLGANVWSTLEDGSAWRGLMCNESRDGSVYWIDLTTIRQRTDDGSADRYVSVGFDITKQRVAEERLSLAIKSSHIGLWDWDIESGSTYFSDTFYTMLGYRTGAFPMTVDSWKEICHPDDLDDAMRDIERHCTGEVDTYRNEHRLRRADGSWLWIRDVGEIVERTADGAPRRMIGAHIDIDASKRLDLALRSAVELKVQESEAATITHLCRAVADVTGMSFVGVARRIDDGSDRATLIAGWDDGQPVNTIRVLPHRHAVRQRVRAGALRVGARRLRRVPRRRAPRADGRRGIPRHAPAGFPGPHHRSAHPDQSHADRERRRVRRHLAPLRRARRRGARARRYRVEPAPGARCRGIREPREE